MNNLPRDSRSVAHAMWGVKFSPEIEARVLEFCREIPAAGNSIVGYNFFYGALSTQANKSDASCRRLIELLAHQDTTNIAGRSAWGLQQGVAREQFPLVADAMVKVIEARSDGYLREQRAALSAHLWRCAQCARAQGAPRQTGRDGRVPKVARGDCRQSRATHGRNRAAQATRSCWRRARRPFAKESTGGGAIVACGCGCGGGNARNRSRMARQMVAGQSAQERGRYDADSLRRVRQRMGRDGAGESHSSRSRCRTRRKAAS